MQGPPPPLVPNFTPDPAVAFAELATHCVPVLCDSCCVELDIGDDGHHWISAPAGTDRPADRGASWQWSSPSPDGSPRGLDVPFAGDATPYAAAYSGVATFRWWSREPVAVDVDVAGVLVELTVRTIAWRRSEQDASVAATKAEHLRVALRTNRRIGAAVGIVMSTRNLGPDRAFELLGVVSQQTNRKVRDVAEDVLETGWLDPALLPADAGADRRRASSEGAP